MKLLFATRNPDKLKEIRACFDLPHLDVISAIDRPDLPEVEEDGETLEANAIKKAATLATLSGLWALADDTGLEVDALDGAPGVYSARYAGERATYADNCNKLLEALAGGSNRRACFRSVIALADPDGTTRCVEGRCNGVILTRAQGEGGFGYDPVFLPDGETRSFAELDAPSKNAISHRGRAIAKARQAWASFLATDPARWPAHHKPDQSG